MSVKKVLLKKKVSSTVYDIYAQTSSDIVVFTPAGEDPVDSDVQTELRNLIALVGSTSVASQISTAIAAVVDSAPETFDTLKEIADWITDDSTGAAKMASDISALQTLVGAWTDGQTAATGICARIEAIESAASSVAHINIVASMPDTVNETDLYMLELA